jgi:RNA polymerase sigma factor (TIGR02999 family)
MVGRTIRGGGARVSAPKDPEAIPRRRAPDVTELLVAWGSGDRQALEQLLATVHGELRRLARRELGRERSDHTLQPTALVNELYLRLVEQNRASWQNRAHFFAIAARMMRRILVDHARAHVASKRGGACARVSLSDAMSVANEPAVDLLALDDALATLDKRDPEQARIVELRFFSGLSVEETAAVLGKSPRTIKREWRVAKAWLFSQLR